jgi:hypothetical protein
MSRRPVIKRKDIVTFDMPLKVNEGKVVNVDGAYIMIEVKINGKKILVDRLCNEVQLLEKFSA